MMHRLNTADARRWLLVAVLLVVVIAGAADLGRDGAGDAGPPVLLWLVVLWAVSRGSHVAWVLACTMAALGTVLHGFFLVSGWLSATTFTAAPNAGVLALLYLLLTLALTARPVRAVVGRASSDSGRDAELRDVAPAS